MLSHSAFRLWGSLLPAASSFNPGALNEYNVGFDASWELDLWGKVRRQVEAADAQVDQAADQRRDALVSSLAELARDYIQCGVQTQIKIANDNLKVDRDILALVQERQQRGLQNGLDVENAAAQVEKHSRTASGGRECRSHSGHRSPLKCPPTSCRD
jgi:outer membrane protein TolC